MNTCMLIAAASFAVFVPVAAAQDAVRGARLYADTAARTGKPVASCIACHADVRTLRELIRNRGGRLDDPSALARWLQAVFAGAQPGAVNAKAQYRGVLSAADVRDLAAYIGAAKQAQRASPALALMPFSARSSAPRPH